jgi:hypothetical protein
MTTAPPTTLDLAVGTMNIKNLRDLSRPDTRKCAAQIRAHVDVCGCQETIETGDNEDLNTECPPLFWYHLGVASENDLMASRSKLVLCPVPDLPGKISRNELTFRLSGGVSLLFTPVAVVNFHLVSGVYKSQKDRLGIRRLLQRRELRKLRKQIKWLLSHGCNVIWTADTNWHDGPMPVLHPDQVWLGQHGIDKIGFIPSPTANWTLTGAKQATYANPSDHDFLVVRAQVVANSLYVPPGENVEPGALEVAAANRAILEALGLLDDAVNIGGRTKWTKVARDHLRTQVLGKLPKR